MATDVDLSKDRASIETPKFELTAVLAELMNLDCQGVDK